MKVRPLLAISKVKAPPAAKAAKPAKPAKTLKVPSVTIFAEVTAAQNMLAPAAKRLAKALALLTPEALPGMPVGSVADLLYDLRATAKLVPALYAPFEDAISPALKALEDHFVATLKVGEASGVQGVHSRVQVTESAVPVVRPEDWEKFYAYVAKTKQWELLTHAVSRAAVTERWEQKRQVPFVGVFRAKKISCTKLSGKSTSASGKGGR